jgi:hypothetical protein
VTRVFMRLKEMGLDVPSVYSTEQAIAAMLQLKGECRHA